jgi:DNA-binding HxlR family transcriptional regulator
LSRDLTKNLSAEIVELSSSLRELNRVNIRQRQAISFFEGETRYLRTAREQLREALHDALSWIENYPLNDRPTNDWRDVAERIRSALEANA